MGERIRVLLVDDHRMFSEAIELLLSTADGIEIIGVVGTGEEAVELARTVQPDVILMDIGLPSMDGIEATRKVREVSPNSQIVIVTAFQHGSVVARAVEA